MYTAVVGTATVYTDYNFPEQTALLAQLSRFAGQTNRKFNKFKVAMLKVFTTWPFVIPWINALPVLAAADRETIIASFSSIAGGPPPVSYIGT